VQVADVVVEAGAELADLVLADIDLLGPDAEFQEAVGEVADQEQSCVADEAGCGHGHERCAIADATGGGDGSTGGGRRGHSVSSQ
jgi:hypothetical protein